MTRRSTAAGGSAGREGRRRTAFRAVLFVAPAAVVIFYFGPAL